MCGICGFTGERDTPRLTAMMAALRHRGPDDQGSFESGLVSLGSTRLAIVDVAQGRQPMASEDGSVVVVLNGEIYNAGALRAELISRGHRFRTRCDTEVIPHLYEERGDAFVDRLNGEFAIAVWDAGQRRLLLTRDRIGIKPLYYSEAEGRFLFGSEIKGILAGLESMPAINPEAFFHYLSFKCVPAPLTIYKGVVAVEPGEQVAWDAGRVAKRGYWALTDSPNETSDLGEITEHLEDLLVRSVRRRLIADVPVGVMLSGGLDSSLIVAIAAELVGRPLPTFTLGYTDDFEHKGREVEAARAIARQFGTEHYEYAMTHHELVEDLPAVLRAFDQPFSGVISPYFLNKLVSQHVKVCLSGDGADEQFGSYLAHRLAQPIHQVILHGEEAVRRQPRLVAPFEDDVDRVIGLAHRQDWAWRASLMVFSDQEKRHLLNPDHADYAPFSSTALVRNAFAACQSSDAQTRQQHYDCRTVLPDLVLTFNDRLSMAHSVETRVPFLDHELVEFVSGLPGSLKIRDGCCKWLLKEVARRRLPDHIVDRPKEGFVLPINDWQRGVLRERIEEGLSPARLAQHGLFRTKEVNRLVAEYYAGQTELQYKIWALYCFQVWYENASTGTTAGDRQQAIRDAFSGERAPRELGACLGQTNVTVPA
ncbi:MAG: asparagine synthase (glutamine-hydrolyzing) [Planctomycetes bacterium]|nr:asparagine synthase (glutamine-hydrolyzing) [Planctomycetota bacterium]